MRRPGKKCETRLLGGVVFLVLLGSCTRAAAPRQVTTFVLASTTSTQDSGFLDALAPEFDKDHPNLKMKVVAVGSGEALELGRKGDADVLLVHSPDDEARFMSEGYGETRKPVMSNDFAIAGPPGDPANVNDATDATDAFRRIGNAKAEFVSRGDESGTHKKELKLWKAAGIDIDGDWYLSSGQGMAETLVIASESSAYVLTDTATFKATRPQGLEVAFEGGPDLINPYSVITLKAARKKAAGASFSDWITGTKGRAFIAAFGTKEHGKPLFEVADQ